MPNSPIQISIIGLTSDIPHDETVKDFILENCPTAIVTIRSVAGSHLIYQAYQDALDAGDDIMCDAWNSANRYYSANAFSWQPEFRNVIDTIVSAGKIAIIATTQSGNIPAHFICTSNNSANIAKMWCYGANATVSWSLGQIAGIVGQLWSNHPSENNYDVMARLLGGTSNGLGNRVNAGGWGLARYTESEAITELPLLPIFLPSAEKTANERGVSFTWQNPTQTKWIATRVTKSSDNEIIYEGTDESFVWNSNVQGSETFKFNSVDAEGNLSADETYTQLQVTGLLNYYAVGNVGAITATNTVTPATIQCAQVTNAETYTLEKNEGNGWEVVETNATGLFTLLQNSEIATQLRYKATNQYGSTSYSATATLLGAAGTLQGEASGAIATLTAEEVETATIYYLQKKKYRKNNGTRSKSTRAAHSPIRCRKTKQRNSVTEPVTIAEYRNTATP